MGQLEKSMKNLSLWEVKSYVRKAQNAVLNLSDIEAKVREATNNEPWGASTTLMAEIARGTFNYRDREEICNMIFRRFTEKSAHEWRQIYKSLQLMEYLVKNGSERFVDDARANVSLVSMLKSFHYIDSSGVDQGINIRNRAKELSALLNDEGKIRQERKKAKENSKKFDAISSTSVGTRGIGRRASTRANPSRQASNDDGYETRIFGDGGVYGQRFEENRSTVASPNEFEEYDEGSSGHANTEASARRSSRPTTQTTNVNATSNNIDLFDFNDAPASAAPASSHDINNEDFDEDEDDFDDFQSATPAAALAGNAVPNTASQHNINMSDLLTSSYAPTSYTAPSAAAPAPTTAPVISQPKKNDDIFGSLLMSAKQNSTPAPKQTSIPPSNPVQKPASAPAPAPVSSNSNGIVDLLDL